MAVADPVLLGAAVSRPARLRSRVRIGGWELAGLVVLALVSLVAVFAPVLAPHSTTQPVAAGPFVSPFHGALLGTDDLGRDLLSRTLYGIRSTWLSALAVVGSGIVIGTVIGSVAAMAGGVVDALLMRITDLFLALPGPVLAIVAVVALGPSLPHTLLAVAAVWWPWYARIVRGEVRALLVRPHVDAARLAGTRPIALARRHLLPGAVPAVLTTASLDIGNLVLTLAGLSFLGLGAPPPTPELGAMTANGLTYLLGQPWIALVPACAVFVLAFAANLAGDGVRDLLDAV
ncbi:MAG TPA: ABC transporter permease [Mycobacteriales bacterium]|nr:ABC transporter permease [Mycobacteriales bacterium]